MTAILFQRWREAQSRIPSARLLIDTPVPEQDLFFPEGSEGYVLENEQILSMLDDILPENDAKRLFVRWFDSLRNNTFLVLFPEAILELRPQDIAISCPEPLVNPDVILQMIEEMRAT